MGCCDTEIKTARNEDLRVTYTPNAGFTFNGFTARMQVREYEGAPDPALLTVTMTATVAGSKFEVYGTSMVLTVKKADLLTLPVADPVSDPVVLSYDIIVTDGTGFESRLVWGSFVVEEGVTR